MRNKNTRKALKELSKKSSANGIDMLVEPKKAKEAIRVYGSGIAKPEKNYIS